MTQLQRHYLQLLWQQKRMALLGVLLAIITALAGIALLATSGWFISAAALAGLSAATAIKFDFFTPGAFVRGFSISRTLGRYGERYTSHQATFAVIAQLRADIFRLLARRHHYELPLNRHESASRLLQDIQYIESIYLSALLPATVILATCLGLFCTLAIALPQALYWAVPVILLAVIAMPWLYSRQVMQPQNQLHQSRAQQWQLTSSLLSNLRTLSLHQRLAHTGDTLQAQAAEGDALEIRAVNRQQFCLFITQCLLALFAIALFGHGFSAYHSGELAGANLFMLLLLALGCNEVLLGASPIWAAWRLGLAALDRLEALTPNNANTAAISEQRQFSQGDNQIALHQLSYRYPAQSQAQNQAVLHQFNYTFNTGAQGGNWYWICGKSGAGKSTLIALLAGQLQANSGSIYITSPSNSAPGLMPQRIDILRASLRDNLCLHAPHSDSDLLAALQIVELDHWAQALHQGLATWLGDGEWQPSGGESKRIGLARLILQNPDIILLDEPSAGLDPALAQRIFTRLANHWHNKLIIANTHDRSLIQAGQSVVELE